MIHLFFIIGVLFILVELFLYAIAEKYVAFLNSIETIKEIKKYRKLTPEEEIQEGRNGPIAFLLFLLMAFFIVWSLVGLLTDQYVVFLIILLYGLVIGSLVRKVVGKVIGFKINTIVFILLILFAIINHYHWHIQLGKTLFLN